MEKHSLIVLASVVLALAVVGVTANTLSSRLAPEKIKANKVKLVIRNDTVVYSGKDGVDALRLLKRTASVKEDFLGMVTEIDNRKANLSKKEFWAFYINDKLSSSAPSEYKTSKTDRIMWKIEHFD